MDHLTRIITEQLQLQQESFGLDPRELQGEARAEFVRWNVVALEDELHEALNELKWKPWLTDGSQGEWKSREFYVGELVDALHFFINLLLVAGHDELYLLDPDEIGEMLLEAYLEKRATNARRQAEGYSGEKDQDGRETDRSS